MIDQDFIASLPNDPEAAWPLYEAHIRKECTIYDIENRGSFLDKKKYICLIVAFINQYNIGLDIEDPTSFNHHSFEEYFYDAEIKIMIFTAQMALKNSKRIGLYALEPNLKREIHHYINQIREIVNNVELRANKKEALLNRLNEFAKEVDKDRTRGEIWASTYISFKAEIKDGAEALEQALKPLEKIADIFGKAKEFVDMLKPPEKRISIEDHSKANSSMNYSDDEIPF